MKTDKMQKRTDMHLLKLSVGPVSSQFVPVHPYQVEHLQKPDPLVKAVSK